MNTVQNSDLRSYRRRDEIVFGKPLDWQNRQFGPGVCARFEGLSVAGIKELVELGFIGLEERMNSSPSVGQFLEFAEPMGVRGYEFSFAGFTYDPANSFTEVVLEGISYNGSYPAEIGLAFVKFFIPFRPDEITIEDAELAAWWD